MASVTYEDHGDGEPLVLLHGFGGGADDWRHVFDLPQLPYRVIRWNARVRLPQAHRRCAIDLIELLDELGLDRVRAIGMSMGGNTLLHAATIAPSRIDAMVIVSATTHFGPEARAIMRAAPEPEPRAWAESDDEMSFTPDDLSRITAKTLVVAGDRDPLYPIAIAHDMARAIPNAELHVVEGGGHGPIFGADAPAFAAKALAFLRDRTRARRRRP